VVCSFLHLGDFAAASRACRLWRSAAGLQSAWPELSVERLINGLINNQYSWIHSRSVRVDADRLSDGVLERLAQSAKWRRLTELHLDGYPNKSVSLSQVAQLQHLQSLRLERVRLADVAAGFSSLAPRLLALKCESIGDAAAVHSHLHLLVNLRALALDRLTKIDGQALLPLHQLEYLQLRDINSLSHSLLLAIRRLSVQHRLRQLSITSYTRPALDLDPLVAELSGADGGLAPAALATIRLRCELSDAAPSALLSLPNLTRLN